MSASPTRFLLSLRITITYLTALHIIHANTTSHMQCHHPHSPITTGCSTPHTTAASAYTSAHTRSNFTIIRPFRRHFPCRSPYLHFYINSQKKITHFPSRRPDIPYPQRHLPENQEAHQGIEPRHTAHLISRRATITLVRQKGTAVPH